MKIKSQIFVVFVILSVIFIFIIVSVILQNRIASRMNQQVIIADAIAHEAVELGYRAEDYLTFREPSQLARMRSDVSFFVQLAATLRPETVEQRSLLASMTATAQRMKEIFDEIASGHTVPQAVWNAIPIETDTIISNSSQLSRGLHDELIGLQRMTTLLLVCSLLAFGMFLLAIYFYYYRRMTNSISKLVDGIEIIGSGKLEYTIQEGSNDEIGVLARAFNRMSANLKNIIATKSELEKEIAEREHIESILRHNEGKISRILESVQELVTVWEVVRNDKGVVIERILLDANGACLEFAGVRSLDALRGVTGASLFGKDAAAKNLPMIRKAMETGAPQTFLWKIRDREFLTTVAPIDAKTFLATGKDITDIKYAEDALRESEEKFRNLAEQLPNMIVILDTKGRVVYANRLCEELLGYSLKDATSGPFDLSSTIAPEFLREADGNMKTYMSGRAVPLHESMVITKNGRRINVMVNTKVIRYGKEDMILGVITDITEHKKIESALRESEEKFRNLAEQMPHMIFMNVRGRVVYANHACRDMTGYTQEELTSDTFDFRSITAPEYLPLVEEKLQAHLRGENVAPYEYAIITKHGRRIDTIISTKLINYGTERAILGVVTDITARKRAEEAKNRFIAVLAHELRNPLAPLLSSIQMLEAHTAPQSSDTHRRAIDPVLKESVDIASRQVGNMSRLLDDLLDASRIERGKIQLKKERVNIEVAVQNASESVRGAIESKRQILSILLPAEPILLDADPLRLEQVIVNLLKNATKFTQSDGHIWLSCERDDASVALRVKDDGIGILPEYIPNIFQPFYQITNVMDRTQGGLGLGLMLVQNLCHLHGGSVEARSEGSNKGSEFIVRLPALPPGTAPVSTEARTESVPRTKKRILIVDDNTDAATSLAKLLERHGHEVRTCNDGRSAVSEVAIFRPEAVLLDIGLPGMSGYEVARTLRAQERGDRKMIIAAVTGYGQEEDRKRSKDAGFDHHFVKPIDIAALENALASSGVAMQHEE